MHVMNERDITPFTCNLVSIQLYKSQLDTKGEVENINYTPLNQMSQYKSSKITTHANNTEEKK